MGCLKIKKESSLVRLFNALPKYLAVDVYIDDILVFSDLNYSEFTKYVYSENANHKFDVYEAGTKENSIITEMVNVPDGELITVAIIGSLQNLSLLVIVDYASKNTSHEYSSARIIHLDISTPGVDIYIDDEILFTDIRYKQGTKYLDFNPGKYHIKLVDHENEKVILPLKINLKPERIYTIYIVRNSNKAGVIQSVDGNTYICR